MHRGMRLRFWRTDCPRERRMCLRYPKRRRRVSTQEKIGTEHLLIAMIKETECVASRLLNTLSVNVQKMYVDTLIAMGEDVSQVGG